MTYRVERSGILETAVPDLVNSLGCLLGRVALWIGRYAEDCSSFDAFLVVLVEAVPAPLEFSPYPAFAGEVGGADLVSGARV